MTSKAVRKIVRIDEEKCTGCGVCVPACASTGNLARRRRLCRQGQYQGLRLYAV